MGDVDDWRARGASAEGRHTRLLLAEDDEELRALLSSTLREDGFHVLEASNVAQALRLFERSPVDLVLTDLAMPHGRADDWVDRLRRLARPPVVVTMTAFPDEGIRGHARALGVALLEKPFSLEQLTRTVRDAMSRVPR